MYPQMEFQGPEKGNTDGEYKHVGEKMMVVFKGIIRTADFVQNDSIMNNSSHAPL